MQPYSYDKHILEFPLPSLTPCRLTPFLFLHFCVVSPPVIHRQGPSSGLSTLLILSIIIKTILFLGPLSDLILPAYPLLLLDVVINYLRSGLTACSFANRHAALSSFFS